MNYIFPVILFIAPFLISVSVFRPEFWCSVERFGKLQGIVNPDDHFIAH